MPSIAKSVSGEFNEQFSVAIFSFKAQNGRTYSLYASQSGLTFYQDSVEIMHINRS